MKYHTIKCQSCDAKVERIARVVVATCFVCKMKAAQKRSADRALHKKLVRLFTKKQNIYLHRLPPALRDSLPKGIQRVLADLKF